MGSEINEQVFDEDPCPFKGNESVLLPPFIRAALWFVNGQENGRADREVERKLLGGPFILSLPHIVLKVWQDGKGLRCFSWV